MKILAIDSGNTRVKWGLWDAGGDASSSASAAVPASALVPASSGGWLHVGALRHDELDDATGGLAAALARLPAPARIAVANVAGEGARAALSRALAGLAAPVTWAQSRAAQCGVTNGYGKPETLGVDRWAALIGARHRHPGDCIVVGAGTATTIDILRASGEFRGGVILPGLDLMKRALAENTARLPLADGVFADEPRNTEDAIESGALHAQAGAIERMHARAGADSGSGQVACLLSGGAAARIAAQLALPHRVLDHLVLDGLVRIALEERS
jgi:type III pantothenate kinase